VIGGGNGSLEGQRGRGEDYSEAVKIERRMKIRTNTEGHISVGLLSWRN